MHRQEPLFMSAHNAANPVACAKNIILFCNLFTSFKHAKIYQNHLHCFLPGHAGPAVYVMNTALDFPHAYSQTIQILTSRAEGYWLDSNELPFF